MASRVGKAERVFKTAWFAKAAKKASIRDDELCSAIRQVMLGQADDLGGGVYKKRLAKNLYRSIIVAKGGRYWVYAFLFASRIGPISGTMSCLSFELWQTCIPKKQMRISKRNLG
jgi:hypothetical protein